MNRVPWEYPYERSLAPPGLQRIHSYTRFRIVVLPLVRRDFGARCCYCTGGEDEKGGKEHFELEHFRPKRLFPHLEREWTNLYYACAACNRKKSGTWPEPPTDREAFVDPCESAIYPRYLRIQPDGAVEAGDDPGEYMLSVLELNGRLGVRRLLRARALRVALRDAIRTANRLSVLRALEALEAFERELLGEDEGR